MVPRVHAGGWGYWSKSSISAKTRIFVLKFSRSLYLGNYLSESIHTWTRGRTGLVVRASDSGSGDPGSILGRVGVLFP